MDHQEAILKKRNDNGEMGKGRRRTVMKKIESKKSLQVTFSKRRKGLFRKAEELSILCGVEVTVIAFSPAGKAFTFGDVGSAMDRLSAALHHHHDHKKNKTEEEKNVVENQKVINHEMFSRDGGSEELLDRSSMMMMMGDDELDQRFKNLMKDDVAWSDSCFA